MKLKSRLEKPEIRIFELNFWKNGSNTLCIFFFFFNFLLVKESKALLSTGNTDK